MSHVPVLATLIRAEAWIDLGINGDTVDAFHLGHFRVAVGLVTEAREELDRCVLVATGTTDEWIRRGAEALMRSATNDLLTAINSPPGFGPATAAKVALEQAVRYFTGVDIFMLPTREVDHERH